MNLETFGEFHHADTGIFQFLEALPRFAADRGVQFMTPTEAVKTLKPVDTLSIVHPISWADEARDTSAWLGNKLQNEAFSKLYSVAERVRLSDNRVLKQDWGRLQASDHLSICRPSISPMEPATRCSLPTRHPIRRSPTI